MPRAQAQRTLGRESHVDSCTMENDVRLLLEAGKGAARNRADDEGNGWFHDAEGIRNEKFVISVRRPAHINRVSEHLNSCMRPTRVWLRKRSPRNMAEGLVAIIAFKGRWKKVSGLINNDET